MKDIRIFKWRTTDEDRRSKYILDFRDFLIFLTFFITGFFQEQLFYTFISLAKCVERVQKT